jgi:2,5-diketo-D-gluconate reductase A
MQEVPRITLNDGSTIPQLGFGTWQLQRSETVATVTHALEVGYRHIDTAEMYGNELEVGLAFKVSGLPREDVFITSKLNNNAHEPEQAKKAFEATLSALDLEYIDLFLIHWPLPTKYDGDFISTWRVLEGFKKDGRARSIGVSNFRIEDLRKLAEFCETLPAVNQIEAHPFFQNQELVDYNDSQNIETEAWSPLAQGGELLDNEIIGSIAKVVHKTPAQVVIRWHIQKGYIVFPKSVTTARIDENFKVFDFNLDSFAMQQIDSLDKGETGRTGPNPTTFDMIPKA